MKGFLSFLDSKYPNVRKAFGDRKPGSSEFNQVWKNLAKQMPNEFEDMQHGFIKSTHYDPAATSIKNTVGLDVSKRSKAVQDVLWSTSVQHGAGGAQRIFKRALGSNSDQLSDQEIINRVYDERSAKNGMKYFPSSSTSIRKSVINRFKNERKDALSMLG